MKALYDKILSLFITDAFRYVKKYNYIFFIYISLLTIGVVYITTNAYVNKIENIIENIKSEYDDTLNEYDYGYITDCDSVYIKNINTMLTINKEDIYKYDKKVIDSPPNFIYKNLDLYIPIENDNEIYYVNVSNIIYPIVANAFIIYLTMILGSTLFIYKILNDERFSYMFSIHGKETSLQHNILYAIATNINHEVTSPLLTLKSISSDIQYELDITDFGKKEELIHFKKDTYDMLKVADDSIDQIYDILSELSEYNNIQFSNGDRNVRMLCESAVKMINRTSTKKFGTICIDPELEKYSVYHDNGMTNGFFLSVVLNHIKNSLEANSSTLCILLHNVDHEYLYLHITDNGNGVAPSVKETLFELDVSTNNELDGSKKRGAGLYINRLLLSIKYDGDVKLIESIPGVSTTFCIKIRYDIYMNKK